MEDIKPVGSEPTDTRIGKFDNAEQLLAAYNALESEFTKRCQLVKELQAELEASRAQAEERSHEADNADAQSSVRVRDMLDRAAESKSESGATESDDECSADGETAQAAKSPQDGETTQAAVTAAAVQEPSALDAEELHRRAVADALEVLAENAEECAELIASMPPVAAACIARYKQRLIGMGAVGSPSGLAVLAPVKRPRTLSDAKRLADEMLK